MKTLLSELDKLGLQPFGYDMPDRHSPIVAFETPDFERIGTSLIKAGIIIWAKDGRVRTSPHFLQTHVSSTSQSSRVDSQTGHLISVFTFA